VDLVLIIGTSLKVSPVAEAPGLVEAVGCHTPRLNLVSALLGYLPHSVPQILINRTPINHINPDVSCM